MNLEHFIQSRIDLARSVIMEEESLSATRINELAQLIHTTFSTGRRIAFVGNGGSAAEAMHLAAEFTGKCVIEHKPLPALCLNESQSALTAIANDYGVDFMFVKEVEGFLKRNKNYVIIFQMKNGYSHRAGIYPARMTSMSEDLVLEDTL